MGGDQVVAVNRNPDAGHLGRSILADSHEVAERAGADEVLCRVREAHSVV